VVEPKAVEPQPSIPRTQARMFTEEMGRRLAALGLGREATLAEKMAIKLAIREEMPELARPEVTA
jgi:hypothetical protein